VAFSVFAQTLAIYIAGAGYGDRRGGLVRLLRMPYHRRRAVPGISAQGVLYFERIMNVIRM
jgi:hypothetical protein